jgi:Chitinase class I
VLRPGLRVVASAPNPIRSIVVLAAALSLAAISGRVEAACSNFAYCTAYSTGTVVVYNGAAYTAVAPIAANRDCSTWTPATDNWWSAGGACGAIATSTPVPVATATPSTSGGGGGIGSIVSSSQFDQMWSPGSRAATYTYSDFVSAAKTYYPALCGTGSTTQMKRECAGYFASKDQETGMGRYDRELYCQPGGGGYGGAACNYCDAGNQPCGACASGQQYWGRHAVQLSWNYNYCNGGTQIGVGLHADPNSIFNNKVTGWRVSDWYWMTQLGPAVSNGYGTWPQETAHAAITSTASGLHGFGGIIRAVNGSIECGSRIQQQINRVTYFVGGGYNEAAPGSGSTAAILGYAGSAADGISGQHLWCSP